MKEFKRNPIVEELITSIPIEQAIYSESDAIKYLLILNRTWWNSTYTTDVFDYEKIIFLEQEYKDSPKIQNLINVLKENIAKNYRLRMQYLARLTDNIEDPLFDSTHKMVGFTMNDLQDSILYSERGPYGK